MIKKWLQICGLIATLSLMLGCGADDAPSKPGAKSLADQTDKGVDTQHSSDQTKEGELVFDHTVEPPAEYYDQLFQDGMKSVGLTSFNLAASDDIQVLYLEFNGMSLSKGYGLGQSFILCSRKATIPSSGYSVNEQDQIMEMVQNYYDAAMASVEVTNTKPATGPYTTVIVGGVYRDLGCAGGGSILGVAPLDRGNNNKNDIGFAFVRGGQSVFLAATTVAHEAGHSFGLDHISNNTAIMNPSHAKGITGFKEGRVSRGVGTQNSPKVLQANLGVIDPNMPRPQPIPPSQPTTPPAPTTPSNPNVPNIPNLPAPGGNIPGLPGLDQILAGLPGLDILGILGQLLNGANPGQLPFDINQLIPQIGGLIPGGLQNAPNIGGLPGLDNLLSTVMASAAAGATMNSNSNMNIDQLLQAALAGGNLGGQGVGDFASLLSFITQQAGGTTPTAGGLGGLIGRIIGGMTGGGAATTPSTPNIPATLPDFSSLLGLTQFQTVEDLNWGMRGHSQVVSQNFSGAQRDSLSTLLKLAYLQRFNDIKK